MKFRNTLFVGLALAVSLTGCATSKLTESGDKVRVLDPQEVSTCRKLGETNASTTADTLGIERPIETIAKELRLAARNAAGRMGGDTIVPLTVISEGQQTFEVYKCIDPEN